MSFTRFSDDPSRIEKQLDQTTFVGRYMLDVPGAGMDLPFVEDPQVRMQKWGANLQTNTVALESELLGLTRKLGRDYDSDEYTKHTVPSEMMTYPTQKPIVEESRATHPAWTFRDLEHPRWEEPWLNPQANLEKRFQDNIQTRILEKDYFKEPMVPEIPVGEFYLGDMNDAAFNYYGGYAIPQGTYGHQNPSLN
jgi:hypothetical protein